MSDEDVELDPEAKQLQLQLLKEETRQKIAEARAATITSETSAAKGVLTEAQDKLIAAAVNLGDKGGASLVPVVAANQLGRVAKAIADDVVGKLPARARLFAVDDRSVAEGDVVYLAVSGRIERYLTELTIMDDAVRADIASAQPPAGADGAGAPQAQPEFAAAAGLTTAASLAVDVAALFKQEIVVTPREVAVEASTLVAEMARLLQGRVTVVLPGFGILEQSTLYARFDAALSKRLELERSVARAECVVLELKIRRVAELIEDLGKLRASHAAAIANADSGDLASTVKAAIDSLRTDLASEETGAFLATRANVATARKLLTAFDEFVKEITVMPSGGTQSPLASAALREQFRGRQNGAGGVDGESFLMHVAITAQGGDAVSRSGFFLWANRAAFLAAVQATFVVARPNGEVVASGVITRFGSATYDFSSLTLRDTAP